MATQPAVQPTKAEAPVQKRIRAVHGRMQHPFTLVWFDTESSKKVEVDSWTTIQLQAGKLAEDE